MGSDMIELLERAKEEYQKSNLEVARNLLGVLLTINPEYERAWKLLFNCMDRKEEKIYCLQQIVKINPKDIQALSLLNANTAIESNIPEFIPDKEILDSVRRSLYDEITVLNDEIQTLDIKLSVRRGDVKTIDRSHDGGMLIFVGLALTSTGIGALLGIPLIMLSIADNVGRWNEKNKTLDEISQFQSAISRKKVKKKHLLEQVRRLEILKPCERNRY